MHTPLHKEPVLAHDTAGLHEDSTLTTEYLVLHLWLFNSKNEVQVHIYKLLFSLKFISMFCMTCYFLNIMIEVSDIPHMSINLVDLQD